SAAPRLRRTLPTYPRRAAPRRAPEFYDLAAVWPPESLERRRIMRRPARSEFSLAAPRALRSSPRFGRASSVKPEPGKQHTNIEQGGCVQLYLTTRANARSIMISVAGWKITLLPKTWP